MLLVSVQSPFNFLVIVRVVSATCLRSCLSGMSCSRSFAARYRAAVLGPFFFISRNLCFQSIFKIMYFVLARTNLWLDWANDNSDSQLGLVDHA